MPLVRKGSLSGFYLPDYDSESILSLLSSLIRSRGGKSPHAELNGLSAQDLSGVRQLIYLVIDGLGQEQLDQFTAAGRGKHFLSTHPHRTISTVFPATTAAAITTFTTGASPKEHAVLGWHLHLPDIGCVTTILPATTRMGIPMATTEFSLRDYLQLPSHVDSVPCSTHLLSFGNIARSRYSLAGTRWDERASFSTLRGLERQVLALARERNFGLAHAYWPGYDSLCHEVGCEHPGALRHLDGIDQMLARLAEALAPTGTVCVVTADHGLVDAPPGATVELRDIPGFYDCLAMLPSGDARGVHCFVRPAKVQKFLDIVETELASACVCLTADEVMALEVFGPGDEHPSLRARVGDFLLLARDHHALAATPRGLDSHIKAANHGGMSAREVRVPLFVIGA